MEIARIKAVKIQSTGLFFSILGGFSKKKTLVSCDSMIDIVLIVWRLVFMFNSMNIVTIF